MKAFLHSVWSLTKITFARLRFLAVFAVVGLLVGYWDTVRNYMDKWTRPPVAPDVLAATSDVEYFCVMHPNIIRSEPGNCPLCGMPLSKRKKGEKIRLPQDVVGRVQLTPHRIALAGVETTLVEPRSLVREIHAVGVLDYNETKVVQLSARVPGRADELYVQYAGQPVQLDQPLYSIYSPEVYTAQREYLDARKRANDLAKEGSADAQHDAAAVYNASMQKLVLWGMTGKQLDELDQKYDQSGRVSDHFTVTSPISGVVVRKSIYEGGYVQTGDTPFVIANLDTLWLQAQIDEDDVAAVDVGDRADVSVDALPNETFHGKVTFMGFQLDPQRRTLTARIEVPNADHRIRPGMFASATLRLPVVAKGPTTQAAQPAMQNGMTAEKRAAVFEEALQPYLEAHKELVASRKDKVSPLLHEALAKLKPIANDPAIKGDYEKLTESVHRTMGQNLDDLRETFKEVSQAMIAIGKTTGIPQNAPAIAEFRCPMKKANWLQQAGDTQNPYAPEEMLTCGSAIANIPRVSAGAKPTSRPTVPAGQTLAVPRSAVIDTGRYKVVFVTAKNADGVEMEGVFDQKIVKLGALAGDWYPVVSGLSEGDRIVTRGAFLLDAENRINPLPTEDSSSPATTQPAGHRH